VVYRTKEPTSACRALPQVSGLIVHATARTIRCLRPTDPGFHEHTAEVNRLETRADPLLRDSLAALLQIPGDPTEPTERNDIYENTLFMSLVSLYWREMF